MKQEEKSPTSELCNKRKINKETYGEVSEQSNRLYIKQPNIFSKKVVVLLIKLAEFYYTLYLIFIVFINSFISLLLIHRLLISSTSLFFQNQLIAHKEKQHYVSHKWSQKLQMKEKCVTKQYKKLHINTFMTYFKSAENCSS